MLEIHRKKHKAEAGRTIMRDSPWAPQQILDMRSSEVTAPRPDSGLSGMPSRKAGCCTAGLPLGEMGSTSLSTTTLMVMLSTSMSPW